MVSRPIAPAPIAKRAPVRHDAHGQIRLDAYDWMRAKNWQEVMSNPSALDPEIRAHLDQENAHFASYWTDRETSKAVLFEELKGRVKEQDDSLPTKHVTHSYWSRFETGQQYPILMRAPTADLAAAEVVWDQNRAAAGQPFYALGVAAADPNDQLIILGEDTTGSEQYDLRVYDMARRIFLPDLLPKTGGGGVWDATGESFFYTRLDACHRPYQVLRHILGTPETEDQLVFEETDPGFFAGVSKTNSGQFILIQTGDHITTEVHVLPATAPAQPPRLIVERHTGHEYSLTHAGDWFYILTNQGGRAVDFEICRAPVADPARDQWQALVPHQAGHLILDHFTTSQYLVRMERRAALPHLIVRDLATGRERDLTFDEPAYALGAGVASGDFEDQFIRFTYSSPATPNSTYDLDLPSGTRTLRKVQEVPSGHEASDYLVERYMVTARDGAQVPLTILRRKDLETPAPAYVYGYGSYGMATPASFSPHAFSLVNRGLIYAIAHIRGGMEQGYAWYLDGKGGKKQNTFNDFEDCVRFLIDQNLSQIGKIAIEGGSAGGLLMGTVMNQAPELFGAVVAHVPFVDVLNTISDPSLPLTPMEWNEWGNPIEDPEAYAAIAAYSPYDQVRTQAYPPLMVTAGLTDPRVTYWEPAKWVAKLRAHRTNEEPLIFKTNMEAGHGGRSGRFEHLREKAEAYGFILDVLYQPKN